MLNATSALSSAPSWLVAAIGPGTSALEAAATAVGAGIVLGGFVAGTALLFDRGGGDRTQPVADAGYGGGWVAVLALVVDVLR